MVTFKPARRSSVWEGSLGTDYFSGVCTLDVTHSQLARQRNLNQRTTTGQRVSAPSEGTSDALRRVFDQLAGKRSALLSALSREETMLLTDYGIRVSGDRADLEDHVDLLSSAGVRASLRPETVAWLTDLDMRAHIASTNTTLLARASRERIDGCVLTAEVQTGGRGRRGRQWLSPFGKNLAVSLGFAIGRPLAEVGALSLVVGVAVRRALVGAGLSGVELKWPNDVLLDGRKLAGILIELVRATEPVEVVVGIGVNVGCAGAVGSRIDQPVADVAEQLDRPSRTALLADIVNHVVTACRDFDRRGFSAFRDEWQAAHRHQGQPVIVTQPAVGGAAGQTIAGTALGIAADGSLRVDTADGVREFNGGEVSVRE